VNTGRPWLAKSADLRDVTNIVVSSVSSSSTFLDQQVNIKSPPRQHDAPNQRRKNLQNTIRKPLAQRQMQFIRLQNLPSPKQEPRPHDQVAICRSQSIHSRSNHEKASSPSIKQLVRKMNGRALDCPSRSSHGNQTRKACPSDQPEPILAVQKFEPAPRHRPEHAKRAARRYNAFIDETGAGTSSQMFDRRYDSVIGSEERLARNTPRKHRTKNQNIAAKTSVPGASLLRCVRTR